MPEVQVTENRLPVKEMARVQDLKVIHLEARMLQERKVLLNQVMVILGRWEAVL